MQAAVTTSQRRRPASAAQVEAAIVLRAHPGLANLLSTPKRDAIAGVFGFTAIQ
jgi:hypothetical protein